MHTNKKDLAFFHICSQKIYGQLFSRLLASAFLNEFSKGKMVFIVESMLYFADPTNEF